MATTDPPFFYEGFYSLTLNDCLMSRKEISLASFLACLGFETLAFYGSRNTFELSVRRSYPRSVKNNGPACMSLLVLDLGGVLTRVPGRGLGICLAKVFATSVWFGVFHKTRGQHGLVGTDHHFPKKIISFGQLDQGAHASGCRDCKVPPGEGALYNCHYPQLRFSLRKGAFCSPLKRYIPGKVKFGSKWASLWVFKTKRPFC
jgi:hypothetical protein